MQIQKSYMCVCVCVCERERERVRERECVWYEMLNMTLYICLMRLKYLNESSVHPSRILHTLILDPSVCLNGSERAHNQPVFLIVTVTYESLLKLKFSKSHSTNKL